MDGFFGYNQISITDEDKLKTTFVVEGDVYANNLMLIVLCNVPTTFQRIILDIFDKISVGNLCTFLDDWSIFSGQDIHFAALGEYMERCRRARLALNLIKFRFVVPQGKLLGHIVCKTRLKIDLDKVCVIVEKEAPTDISGVKSFLGHIGYYKRVIKNFAQVSCPLDRMTRKGEPYVWGMEQETSFKELKARLLGPPILAYPN